MVEGAAAGSSFEHPAKRTLKSSSQVAIVFTAALWLVSACDKKPSSEPLRRAEKGAAQTAAPTKLGDLSTSLAAVREAFNARKGEARFLTLLSPT